VTAHDRAGVRPRPGIATVPALLGCGAVAGPLFVCAFLIEGATRADYDPLRHPVSSLALGEHGWTQALNFVVAGLLSLAFAIGLRAVLRPGRASLWGPLLIGMWGISLVGAGVFVTDPLSGYPPGTPDLPAAFSTTGRLHDAFGLLSFVSLPAACMVLARRFAGRRERAWACYSVATGVVFAIVWMLAGAGFEQNQALVDVAGLLQRIAVTIGWAWLTSLAVYAIGAWRSRCEPPGH
jgi:hypothetical membrane protein